MQLPIGDQALWGLAFVGVGDVEVVQVEDEAYLGGLRVEGERFAGFLRLLLQVDQLAVGEAGAGVLHACVQC